MIVKAADQTKREYCIAVMNRLCHKNSICPANHNVDYQYGWFYFDDNKPEQRPELTREAEDEMKNPATCVGYWQGANTYIIIDNPDYQEDDDWDDWQETQETQQTSNVGPYSGLTKQELAKSGTCETDWF